MVLAYYSLFTDNITIYDFYFTISQELSSIVELYQQCELLPERKGKVKEFHMINRE